MEPHEGRARAGGAQVGQPARLEHVEGLRPAALEAAAPRPLPPPPQQPVGPAQPIAEAVVEGVEAPAEAQIGLQHGSRHEGPGGVPR
ncbi:MAG: hypothetical protein ACK559_35580, partial [bacterium]